MLFIVGADAGWKSRHLVDSTPDVLPQFRALLEDGPQWGIRLSYAEQSRADGIARALQIAETFLDGGPSGLMLRDNFFYSSGLLPMLGRAACRTDDATVFAYRISDAQRYGVVGFDADGRAVSLAEKPAQPASDYAVTRLYFYDGDAADLAMSLRPSARGELEVSDLNRVYLEGGTLDVKKIGRGIAWLDTGNPDTLLQAANFVQIVEQRQGLKIACLGEIALNLGLIDLDEIRALAQPIANSDYGRYLLRLADEHVASVP